MMAQLDELRSQIRSRSQQRVLLLLFRVAHKQEPLGTEGYLAHHGVVVGILRRLHRAQNIQPASPSA